MDDTFVMQVLDGARDSPHDLSGVTVGNQACHSQHVTDKITDTQVDITDRS